MKTTLVIGLTALLGTTVFGTNQILDEMTYGGTNYFVRSSSYQARIHFDSWNRKDSTNYFWSYNFPIACTQNFPSYSWIDCFAMR
ncbi:MAG: hypothetical protein FWG50_02515 [Kiritimatiellaeota bacterium]|nr:hypothetical protein [Kiritimatiellota bacterium]